LHGSIQSDGVTFAWHDFTAATGVDWALSSDLGRVEICLNWSGQGSVTTGASEARFTPMTAGFYRLGSEGLRAVRQANQHHQFLTVKMGEAFLRKHLAQAAPQVHPVIRAALADQPAVSAVTDVSPLTSRQQQLVASLRSPPILAAAQPFWYQAKALELAAELFFVAPGQAELFCHRQQRLAGERVDAAIALLRANLAKPISLGELGRHVGCSPFHLSRTFSLTTGMTIPQYLRQLRLERAAELLRSGHYNVTEAALDVGYSSLSHFTAAFREMFGCCPGLYPARPSAGAKPGAS
jgi:AraC family transcriptional regulator